MTSVNITVFYCDDLMYFIHYDRAWPYISPVGEVHQGEQ